MRIDHIHSAFVSLMAQGEELLAWVFALNFREMGKRFHIGSRRLPHAGDASDRSSEARRRGRVATLVSRVAHVFFHFLPLSHHKCELQDGENITPLLGHVQLDKGLLGGAPSFFMVQDWMSVTVVNRGDANIFEERFRLRTASWFVSKDGDPWTKFPGIFLYYREEKSHLYRQNQTNIACLHMFYTKIHCFTSPNSPAQSARLPGASQHPGAPRQLRALAAARHQRGHGAGGDRCVPEPVVGVTVYINDKPNLLSFRCSATY